ncbi:Transcription initiation factor TFIID subunit 4 [Caligus rogercresseyi]|uniref:Transcription initiation factor TFIID subunit 4 n=1 Tax=Caligus rogercresseyi TaxID=217165 RepID=A0A7T8JZ52_CALRO|nr:Transcription initiation factor TFIID subunit 4 [Caligus rogercresseyi]
MGGVNLQEESQRMQGPSDLIGTQIRSIKDETFLQSGQLTAKVSKLCRERGLEDPPSDAISLISHATEERLKTLLEKLSVIAEHRMDVLKVEENYVVTQDVKSQLSFLGIWTSWSGDGMMRPSGSFSCEPLAHGQRQRILKRKS